MTRRKPILFGAPIAILASVAIVMALMQTGAPSDLQQPERPSGAELESEAESEGEAGEEPFPPALSRHLEELSRALPGEQGMSEEGPGSAAEAAFLERAYPDDRISVADMSGARAAFRAISKRPFPRGKPQPGSWVSVGPSQALYAF
jgi:hypothetical protein